MANLAAMTAGPSPSAPTPAAAWPFSVVILTLNEERNLPLCLASLGGCDDIVILDSGSGDGTVAIAQAAGARTFTRRFDNFALQRNYAQREIGFRHPWVFHLDADESFTAALAAECARAVAAPSAAALDGYYVAPRMMFEGRWIPHCTDYPAWQARFVRAPQFAFVEVGHGQREASGMRLGRLRASYLHDLSAGGEAEWLEKHQRYARAEALSHRREPGAWRGLFSRSALTRRRALKQSTAAVPCRPAVRFLYQYVLRGGFLDGLPGLHYCRLLARYEGLIAEEKRHLRHA
jgi:glycosyltransferase involved in cell wall biosynthesis